MIHTTILALEISSVIIGYLMTGYALFRVNLLIHPIVMIGDAWGRNLSPHAENFLASPDPEPLDNVFIQTFYFWPFVLGISAFVGIFNGVSAIHRTLRSLAIKPSPIEPTKTHEQIAAEHEIEIFLNPTQALVVEPVVVIVEPPCLIEHSPDVAISEYNNIQFKSYVRQIEPIT